MVLCTCGHTDEFHEQFQLHGVVGKCFRWECFCDGFIEHFEGDDDTHKRYRKRNN